MGSALLAGCIDQGIVAAGDVLVIEPVAAAREAAAKLGVKVAEGAEALAGRAAPDLVLVAVKPQVMDEVLPPYRAFAETGTVFLSIAAGRTTDLSPVSSAPPRRWCGAMPNTPAQVGRGITALYPVPAVTKAQREMCAALMGAVGEVVWLGDEVLMDAVTAVSGSGPAYVFHLIEALAEAARAAGLPGDMADKLARATVTGAAELAYRSDETAAELRPRSPARAAPPPPRSRC